jgi:WD40 repeat protein
MRCLAVLAFLVVTSAAAAEPETGKLDRHGDPLPPLAVQRLGALRFRHEAPVTAVAFSPDGKRVASASAAGDVVVWEWPSGKRLSRMRLSSGWAFRLLFAPDGQRLAAWGGPFADCVFQVWNVADGKELVNDRPGLQYGTHAAFSADGKTIVSVRAGRWVVLWNLPAGQLLSPDPTSGPVCAVAVAPDGIVLAAVEEGQTIGIHEIGPKGKRRSALPVSDRVAVAVVLTPDGATAAVGGRDGWLGLYDTATGKEQRHLPGHWGRVGHLAFSADGRTLVSGNDAGTLRVWDVPSGKERLVLTNTPGAGVPSADGTTLAVFGRNGPHSILFRDGDGKERQPFDGQVGPVSVVAFTPDGKSVLTAAATPGEPALLWDAERGTVRHRFGGAAGVRGAALSPDGRSLVTYGGAPDSLLTLSNLPGTERRRLLFPADTMNSCEAPVFSPDGSVLAAVLREDSDRRSTVICFWEVGSGKILRKFSLPGRSVHALAFSPDGKTLVCAEEIVSFWDLASGAELPPGLRGKHGFPAALAFAPDGRWLVTHGDRDSFLWETASRQSICFFPPGRAVAFSADGRFLALGDATGRIRLLDAAGGGELLQLDGAEGVVESLAFSADGKRLAAGNRNGTVLIWDVSSLPGRVPRPPAVPTDLRTLEGRWADLRGRAPVAYRAVAELTAAGAPAVAFLSERLIKAEVPDPRRLPKLIRDLDDEEFAVREAATRELRIWGPEADLPLRRALEDRPSPEQHRRLLDIQLTRERDPLVPEEVRCQRAVAVLERVGSPEAKATLEKLARGPNDARLTQDAQVALRRLASGGR